MSILEKLGGNAINFINGKARKALRVIPIEILLEDNDDDKLNIEQVKK